MNTMGLGLHHKYLLSRQFVADGSASTLLEIRDCESDVVCGHGDTPNVRETLSIGTQSLADTYFSHSPPSAENLERAIYAIEDEVMRIRHSIQTNSTLVTVDVAMIRVADAAGAVSGDASAMLLDALEQLYQRVAAIAEGRPVTQDNLPVDTEFFGRVLILREFMHHLGFSEVRLLAD